MTREELLTKCVEVLTETFGIDATIIKPEARLYEDLDIDSIDAVDLIVQLKPVVGKRMTPEAFKKVRTVQDVVDALYKLIHSDDVANPAA
jgi:acyl carrier protein